MPAPISFGARTGRDNNYVGVVKQEKGNVIGPGEYRISGGISPPKPSYAPFGTTEKRKFSGATPGKFQTPSPLDYDVKAQSEPVPIRGPFKGTAPRMPAPKMRDITPGPGEYKIPTTIKPAKPSLQRSYFDETPDWSRIATAPSIPANNQCYGYEESSDGNLIMQRPVKAGFKGSHNDSVGPMDYKPKFTQTHKTANVINFGKGTSRPDVTSKIAGMNKDMSTPFGSPGPGSYNLEGKTNTSAAKQPVGRKRNAVFESKVVRLKEKRASELQGPSPTSYNIPSTLKIQERPDHVQCFGTSSNRFATDRRSIGPAPGSYGKPLSDFERKAMEARKLKMRQPAHKEAVPFGTSGGRFTKAHNADFAAAPGSYDFQDTLANQLKKKLVSRNGAFGSTAKRFPKFEAQTSKSAPASRESLKLATGYNKPAPPSTKQTAKSKAPMRGRPDKNFLNRTTNQAAHEGEKTSSFADTSQRFKKTKEDFAPPPGTYDVRPRWKTNGVVPLYSGPKERIPKEKSTSGDVGPAQYNLASSFGKKPVQNRKDILVSTSSRFNKSYSTDTPGAGSYYPEYSMGNLIRPTFNIAIAE
eukprot:CAMPEP_0118649828 /NCGR_PEP_ID=MMETSP0785-20121206/9914_1 /TAXON_ID=91992 /ORGANISM="Bolidomonas pacifica, Strain CCMP 1866" /LENGTH=582 /DNA_ID=CAMNT_0006542147 /DNA_START=74 /DNA_END=1819 /DNA_ORIENTATION=+